MKILISKLKPYLRWFILGLILFYLIKTVENNWSAIKLIQFNYNDYLLISFAFLVILISHIFAGIIWFLMLRKTFNQVINFFEIVKIYLITNMAKYLPGNIWHFYGRINIIYQQGCSLGIASISVLLEPLLMAASALLITLISHSIGLISISKNNSLFWLELIILILTLISFHPKIINPIIHFISKLKFTNQKQEIEAEKTYLKYYPIWPLMGELIFVILRSMGFLLIILALTTLKISQIPILMSAFCFAWLLGLIVPGAPGGLGIFEATIITLLDQFLSGEIIIISVAIYRITTILAEATGAGLVYIPKLLNFKQKNY